MLFFEDGNIKNEELGNYLAKFKNSDFLVFAIEEGCEKALTFLEHYPRRIDSAVFIKKTINKEFIAKLSPLLDKGIHIDIHSSRDNLMELLKLPIPTNLTLHLN